MRLPQDDRSAIGLLKLLLATCVIVPLLLFALASWLNYQEAMRNAVSGLRRMSEVAHQHAAKVFDSQSQVADRVIDLVRGMDQAEIEASERPLHDAFARIVARLPQVQSVLLAGRDGRPLVSAGVYPVPVDVSVKGKDYFSAVIGGFRGTYVSSLQVGDVNKQLFFGLSQPWLGPDNSVRGVIDVAVLPSFFRDFYQILVSEGAGGPQGKVITLVRDDGQVLVRYPPFEGQPPAAAPNSPFFAAIRAHPEEGNYESRSIIDSDTPTRLYAYQKVEGYPVYVVAGRSRDTIIAGWRRSMASHLMFGLPATIALFAVTWTALSRIRREEGALAVLRQEVTRREAAEAALLKAQRLEAVGQMTGGIAHDFNNLLTIILGSAEMLTRKASNPVMVRRFADQILLAARRGGDVTHQLLAFSRRQVIHPETVDLNRRIREFKQLLDRAAREAVSVELELDPTLVPVRLDPGHFEAAILNLVGNARDAMRQGGTVTIATRNLDLADHAELAPGPYACVTVTDHGIGMDADTAAKAFEPFFTTKEIGAGTGLGLSQVYGFAKQAGGDARIITAPGAGTTIELLLPRAAEGIRDERPAASVPTLPPAAAGKVVLVVEDEPELLTTTVESLHDLGFATLTATSAQAALALLAGPGRIDVLFSDIVMPGGMDGIQLAEAARSMRPAMKILLTSGYAAESRADLGPDCPMLVKPYDRGQLTAGLDALLRA